MAFEYLQPHRHRIAQDHGIRRCRAVHGKHLDTCGGALSTGLVSLTPIISGIKTGQTTAAAIDAEGKLIVKAAMFAIPLVFIVAGYGIYLKKFKIDETYYAGILRDLKDRGELKEE